MSNYAVMIDVFPRHQIAPLVDANNRLRTFRDRDRAVKALRRAVRCYPEGSVGMIIEPFSGTAVFA